MRFWDPGRPREVHEASCSIKQERRCCQTASVSSTNLNKKTTTTPVDRAGRVHVDQQLIHYCCHFLRSTQPLPLHVRGGAPCYIVANTRVVQDISANHPGEPSQMHRESIGVLPRHRADDREDSLEQPIRDVGERADRQQFPRCRVTARPGRAKPGEPHGTGAH